MRGQFMAIWPETRREIWKALAAHEAAPPDMFSELYREFAPCLVKPLTVEKLAEIVYDCKASQRAFLRAKGSDIIGEQELVAFLEAAFAILEDMGGDALANLYFNLLLKFTEKYNLRYELRRPCLLCPTLPGIFGSLLANLKLATSKDAHLDSLMRDFEHAVRDLRNECSPTRIKICIQKQMNLVEAMGSAHRGVNQKTIGQICDQVGTWPHALVKEAMKNIYGFACDYPGIRHGGTAANALRGMEMRDMVAISILLAGFTPYLTDLVDSEMVYGA